MVQMTPYSKWAFQSICKQMADFISISRARDFYLCVDLISCFIRYLAHDLQTTTG